MGLELFNKKTNSIGAGGTVTVLTKIPDIKLEIKMHRIKIKAKYK